MENNNQKNLAQLTDQQIEFISNELDDSYNDEDMKKAQEEAKVPEKGEFKMMNCALDVNSGEQKILGATKEEDLDNETFEEMYERIKNSDIELKTEDITEKELISYISSNSNKDDSLLKEIANETELSPSAIKDLLMIVNRKMNKEEFNIYKAFPEEIRSMIDKYMIDGGIPLVSNQGKQFRNMISESLVDEFIVNISSDKIVTDFNKEIESLFDKGSAEIASSIIGYTEERNKKYREYAETMEDDEKKKQVLSILDNIDESYNLTSLKEFAKKCKIKKYDLERPDKIFAGFLAKYKESSYNIYDINMARPILYRNINKDGEEYTDTDINAFFISLCKQTLNYNPNNSAQHAYMYYVLYNIVLMDLNKGEDTKVISETYLNNIKEVIANLRERNNNFK